MIFMSTMFLFVYVVGWIMGYAYGRSTTLQEWRNNSKKWIDDVAEIAKGLR